MKCPDFTTANLEFYRLAFKVFKVLFKIEIIIITLLNIKFN